MYQIKQFSESQKIAVWNKATIIAGNDPNRYRQDIAGAWIEWIKFGDVSNELGFGWEIDHRKPLAKGGTDELANFRPLQWKNNRSKGDDYPKWSSVISSNDNKNIYLNQTWTIKE